MLQSLADIALLNDGRGIPWLGLGVYQAAAGDETYAAVRAALEAGYRHVDTAAAYQNEGDVGRALRDSGVPRDRVYVTTKLWNADHGFDQARRACEQSLKNLGLDHVDLYLIHWPVEGKRQASWRALEKLQEDGLARSIGVSNYTVRHLEELLNDCQRPPAINQVEFHPYLYQKALLDFCRAKQVQLEAYSPLARGARMDDPNPRGIGARHGKSPAQVLIRWALQHEIVVIPKSTSATRIRENAEVYDFQLDANDMATLDGLNEDLRTCWDPSNAP